jgi:anti-sigma factor RsiW
MTLDGSHPAESRLLALVDGELAAAEGEQVRRHCEGCAACAEAVRRFTTVQEMIRTAAADGPLRSTWPEVRKALDRQARPAFRPIFAAATTAAALAGVILGILLGTPRTRTIEPQGAYLWSVVSTSIVPEDDGTYSDSGSDATASEGR